jgi:hypothetical protein
MNVSRIRLFWRLMIKPLAAEPVRTALTVFAVALGVAVVLAIDLAAGAATGSFHSSLETLSGDQTFEVTANGGVPEELVGRLATAPYGWRIAPRSEDFALVAESKKALPLIGLDLIAEADRLSLHKLRLTLKCLSASSQPSIRFGWANRSASTPATDLSFWSTTGLCSALFGERSPTPTETKQQS